MKQPTQQGHPRFYRLLEELAALHARKNADYAGDDPLSNFREAQRLGVEPWRAALVRMSDKWARLCTLARQGTEQTRNEPFTDSLRDLACYSLLCLILYEGMKTEG
jgi:hypothetical protein